MAVYEYDSQNDKLNRIAGGTLYADLPIGFIIPSFETVAPLGFLKLTDTLANRTVSRTTYKELFDWATERDLIGTGKPFGVGDGSTTFVIPDGKEIAFKGVGEYEGTVGNHVKSGGLANGEFLDDRLQTHVHTVPSQGTPSGTGAASTYYANDTSPVNYLKTGNPENCRTGVTTEVKSLGCHYYIKAKNVGVPADFVSEIDDVIGERLSYSTTEINTGRKWIDGKDIYQITLPCTTQKELTAGAWNDITNGFTGLATVLGTIDSLTKVTLNRTKAYTESPIALKDYPQSNALSIVTANSGNIQISGWITLEYTK